jgi:hypothetical protein
VTGGGRLNQRNMVGEINHRTGGGGRARGTAESAETASGACGLIERM